MLLWCVFISVILALLQMTVTHKVRPLQPTRVKIPNVFISRYIVQHIGVIDVIGETYGEKSI